MKKLIFPVLPAVLLCGCYADKEEALYPAGNCDSAAVTYTTTVKPIIVANCTIAGCHGGSGAASGINLDDYAGLKAIVVSNRLLGVINHASGFSQMPKNASKLPACSIAQITKWVNEGGQNN